MFSKLLSRILQLISARYKSKDVTKDIIIDTPAVEVSVTKPEIEAARLELSDDVGSWTADSIAAEIKIDMAGKIYFKINRTWVEQTAIKSIRFFR